MRGTIIMFAIVLLVLLGGGIYLFTNTAEPMTPPTYDCDLNQLRLSSFWEPATGAMAGALTVENDSVKPCRLEGVPELALRGENGETFTTLPFRFQMEASPLTLNRGGKSLAGFVWRNWCGNEPSSPFILEVKLPNYSASFTVPILDPDGTPSTASPRCDTPEEGSELSTGPFVEEGASLYSDGE